VSITKFSWLALHKYIATFLVHFCNKLYSWLSIYLFYFLKFLESVFEITTFKTFKRKKLFLYVLGALLYLLYSF